MSDERWADARRLEAWAGEVRVNLVRAAALVAFYGYHLLNVYVLKDSAAGGAYHGRVTAVVLAWTASVFVQHACLSRRWVPPALKYVATFWDVILITALLMIGGERHGDPRNPLIFLYFVVLAAAPLRLSLPLVYASTLGVMAAAAFLLGYYVFWSVGRDAYYAPGPENTVRLSRTSEVLFLLSVAAAGVFAGQVVRQASRLVRGYPVIVAEPREKS
jgi:hypothetical protein